MMVAFIVHCFIVREIYKIRQVHNFTTLIYLRRTMYPPFIPLDLLPFSFLSLYLLCFTFISFALFIFPLFSLYYPCSSCITLAFFLFPLLPSSYIPLLSFYSPCCRCIPLTLVLFSLLCWFSPYRAD